jgi:hypothetical protein
MMAAARGASQEDSEVYLRIEAAYSAVIRSEEIPGQMLFFFAKRQFFSVPTAGLTDGELTELRRFIAEREARPATPRA